MKVGGPTLLSPASDKNAPKEKLMLAVTTSEL